MQEAGKRKMEIIEGIQNIHRELKNPVLTIGNFDGVHRGHQALFQRVLDRARSVRGESVVMTFRPHPLDVLAPGKGPLSLTPHGKRLELIESCGIDVTIVIPFDLEFARISARDFVRGLLVETLRARTVVVGHDYRFGRGREGDIDYLRKLGSECGFDVETVSGIRIDGTVVSSTAIRELIRDGDLKEAGRLLGRFYEVEGRVVKGRERGGRLLGFPTANIGICATCQASPRQGVYAVEVELEGMKYKGAANLGYNPTFGDTDLSLEVHILDFSGDIYGKPLLVRFIDRLRDEKKFSGPEELAAQIKKDVLRAREILGGKDV
jgi:riboflavin kinase/FMN adenylyltransferase